METYITVQNIKAEPCSKFEYFQKYNNSNIITFQPNNSDEDGFLVIWPDNHYSWMSKTYFEEDCRKINENQIFPVIDMLKFILTGISEGRTLVRPNDGPYTINGQEIFEKTPDEIMAEKVRKDFKHSIYGMENNK